ncbi:MAG: hypothetical protein V3V48_13825 [Candidatus Aminicenantaceae bacterium]
MRERRRKYEDRSAVDFLLLRDKLGLKRYRKQIKRDEEEKRILIDLGLKKIQESEKKDFILIEYKRRKLKV